MEMNLHELHIDVANKLGVPEDAIEITPTIVEEKLTLAFAVYPEKAGDISETSEEFQRIINSAKEAMKFDPLEDFEDDDEEDERVNGGDGEDDESCPNETDNIEFNLFALYPNGLSLNNDGVFITGGGDFSTEGVEEMLDALTAVCEDNPIAISLIEELTRTLAET